VSNYAIPKKLILGVLAILLLSTVSFGVKEIKYLDINNGNFISIYSLGGVILHRSSTHTPFTEIISRYGATGSGGRPLLLINSRSLIDPILGVRHCGFVEPNLSKFHFYHNDVYKNNNKKQCQLFWEFYNILCSGKLEQLDGIAY